MKPIEVQRSRKPGYRHPPKTKYVGRGTPYSSPFKVSETLSVKKSLRLYRHYILALIDADPNFLEPLRGWNLSCFCKLGNPCHRQILLELANKPKVK